MSNFTLHTEETAPDESKPMIAASKKQNGFLPGLHATMAEAPGLFAAYSFVHEQFMNSSFDNDEKTVVWQAINVEHSCHYCVPAHTGIAKMMKVDDAITEALRNETPLPSDKLEALRTFTLIVVRERGVVTEAQMQAFLNAGYTQRHVLEVILGLAQKVMSNFTNHVAHTPVDAPFQAFEWHKKA